MKCLENQKRYLQMVNIIVSFSQTNLLFGQTFPLNTPKVICHICHRYQGLCVGPHSSRALRAKSHTPHLSQIIRFMCWAPFNSNFKSQKPYSTFVIDDKAYVLGPIQLELWEPKVICHICHRF